MRLFIALFSSFRIIDLPIEPVIVIFPGKKLNTLHYNFQVPIVFTLEPCFDKARGGDNLVSSDKRRQAARMEEEWREVKTWKGKDNSAENGEDS